MGRIFSFISLGNSQIQIGQVCLAHLVLVHLAEDLLNSLLWRPILVLRLLALRTNPSRF
jgi:hypothetical protein